MFGFEWESLAPILFALYYLSRFFGNKKETENNPPTPLPRKVQPLTIQEPIKKATDIHFSTKSLPINIKPEPKTITKKPVEKTMPVTKKTSKTFLLNAKNLRESFILGEILQRKTF